MLLMVLGFRIAEYYSSTTSSIEVRQSVTEYVAYAQEVDARGVRLTAAATLTSTRTQISFLTTSFTALSFDILQAEKLLIKTLQEIEKYAVNRQP